MNPEKRKALEKAGWVFGDYAGDEVKNLELTEDEQKEVELRLAVSRAVRRRRKGKRLTQAQLARMMKTTQANVSRIEGGGMKQKISLDLMFRGLFAVGGSLRDLM